MPPPCAAFPLLPACVVDVLVPLVAAESAAFPRCLRIFEWVRPFESEWCVPVAWSVPADCEAVAPLAPELESPPDCARAGATKASESAPATSDNLSI
jgi:hypothetical protein